MYQLYIRSFADGDGDGIGDIAGIRSRLPYLRDLGVDAVWINPWFPSPMADGGYDVADYRDIDPLFGTLADADALIAEAHALGLRVLLDIVPNHTSDRHPWFAAPSRPAPAAPSDCATCSGTAVGRAGTSRRPTGRASSAARPGPGSWNRTGSPASGTSTCSRRSSPTSTGATRRCAPSSSRSCGSGSTAGRTGSASTSRTGW